MKRLTKRDVEDLINGYDDDPVAALTVALRRVLREPADVNQSVAQLGFDQLIDRVPVTSLPPARRDALHRREQEALDELVTELNEERGLGI